MHVPRGWIVAAIALLGAVAIGVIAAWLVQPGDRPMAGSAPRAATIPIEPAPAPAAAPAPAPSATAVSALAPVVHRAAPRLAPRPRATPDFDPVTVTTINSW